MIKWWQALALSAIGGGIVYVIARAQHTWTKGATREAEQREERETRRAAQADASTAHP